MSENLLSAKDVSIYLSIPLRTVQRLSKEGKIRAVRIGNKWRYSREDIDRYRNFGTDFSREPARRPENFIERRAYPRINANFRCQYSVNLPPFKNINKEGIIKNIGAGGVFLTAREYPEACFGDESASTQGVANANNSSRNKILRGLPREYFIITQEDIEIDDPIDLEFIGIKASGRIIRKGSNGFGIKFRDITNEDKDKIIKYVG